MDARNIAAGFEIPSENYCDQPYVVRTGDGAWLCVMTTGPGNEGQPGQHVIAVRSDDFGQTWSSPVPIEPSDGPEASYAVLLKAPSGRIFCFYNYNTDNLRQVIADDPPFPGGVWNRVDSQGHFVFRYSDDGGRTWSPERYEIPIRTTQIDRENPYGGEIKFFWNVGRAFSCDGTAYCPLHKIGRFGVGGFARSEGVLLCSPDLLNLADPSQAAWQTLPEGESGLRTPPGGGPIAEEQNIVILSDGSFYCVYRTIDGHPAEAYSRDAGRTWTEPRYMRFADGTLIKHPRAANFVWKCENGRYLYWFHNHGGRDYPGRNPAWLCGGIEESSPDGLIIKWSQPEIVLYAENPTEGISYPDLIEQDGRFFITETQKTIARIHEIDRELISGLWNQFSSASLAREPVKMIRECRMCVSTETNMPLLPAFAPSAADSTGFSIEMWMRLPNEVSTCPHVLFTSQAEDNSGILIRSVSQTVEIILSDGQTSHYWQSDPGLLQPDMLHHFCITLDTGPGIIMFIVDSKLCDGGDTRQYGWGRFSPHLRHCNGSPVAWIDSGGEGCVKLLRIYNRPLTTSEAVANFHAGLHSNF